MRKIVFILFIISLLTGQFAPSIGDITVLGIRVSFKHDSDESTTGDGTFLIAQDSLECGDYTLDTPPHNRAYFESQLKAVDSYFHSVSYGKFGISLNNSDIFPIELDSSYQLPNSMAYYHPYGETEEIQDGLIAELFKDAIETAYTISFSNYDVVVVFHAGIGQDFELPFLDPTPEDIPSAYIDSDFLLENLGVPDVGGVSTGIILPETQNHLLYEEAEDIFYGVSNPCEYQFGLTGTFALMMGFAIGLPPLWDTESGESGVGVFALMDQGSNNGRGIIPAPPDAWTRIDAGWESATVVRPTTGMELPSRDSFLNQIVQVDINESEYFLIENRNNWIYEGVDFDSLRWRNRSDDDVLPDYVTYLMDSVDVEVDSLTGVITSVPNYDLGLPSSGLLIWHIDEGKIAEGRESYAVNADREHRGVDLEEADGAQDIGYPSPFLFTDPSSGMWWDMWFAENEGFYYANPGFEGQPPSFGPDTYPNTRSNNGADSYVVIDSISNASDTMSFTVVNSLMADGFPDTSLHIHFLYDFTGDGVPEIIGGRDSLWWQEGITHEKSYFINSLESEFKLASTRYHQYPSYDYYFSYVGKDGDSLIVTNYSFNSESLVFENLFTSKIEGEMPVFIKWWGPEAVVLSWWTSEWYVYEDSVYKYNQVQDSIYAYHKIESYVGYIDLQESKTHDIAINPLGGLLIKEKYLSEPSIETVGLGDYNFKEIGAVDLDLDGNIEILALDFNGIIYVINTNFTFESGFPISLDATSAVLARDLFGDEHPELVVQVDSADIVVLDWKGKEWYRLSNPKESELRMLSQYQGYNCISTESTIWLFDSTATTYGNEWPYIHHDPSNSRSLVAYVDFRVPDANKLIDTHRTYNYPNPTEDGSTTIRVFVESAEKVEINIYDIAGYFVKSLVIDAPTHGEVNEVVWDVSDIESGVYLANVIATKEDRSENKILKIAVVH